MQFAENLDMTASSLSSRYKRGGLPADIIETGAILKWLATDTSKKVWGNGAGMPFGCSIDDIKIIGRIVLTIK